MQLEVKTGLGTAILIIFAITALYVVKLVEKNQLDVEQPIANNQLVSQKKSTQIANPASVFCGQNSGRLEIRTAPDGGQIGYCKFSDGSECEEWKFYRGECKPGDNKSATTDTSDWQTYRNEKYGFEFKYPKKFQVGEMGIQQMQGPSYKAETFNVGSSSETEGFIMHIYVSADPKILIGPSDRETKEDKIIGSVKFSGFSDPGMGDRYGYITKHGNNYFLLDTVFDTGQFNQILSTFKFIN